MSTHRTTKQAAFKLGSLACLARLNLLKLANYEGFPSQDQQGQPDPSNMSPEELAAMQQQEQASPADQLEAVDNDAPNSMPDASTFVDFAQTDDTEQTTQTPGHTEDGLNGRQTNWSGKASLSSGDQGMRTNGMGLPSSGGI